MEQVSCFKKTIPHWIEDFYQMKNFLDALFIFL